MFADGTFLQVASRDSILTIEDFEAVEAVEEAEEVEEVEEADPVRDILCSLSLHWLCPRNNKVERS